MTLAPANERGFVLSLSEFSLFTFTFSKPNFSCLSSSRCKVALDFKRKDGIDTSDGIDPRKKETKTPTLRLIISESYPPHPPKPAIPCSPISPT